MVEKFFFLQTS